MKMEVFVLDLRTQRRGSNYLTAVELNGDRVGILDITQYGTGSIVDAVLACWNELDMAHSGVESVRIAISENRLDVHHIRTYTVRQIRRNQYVFICEEGESK